jgi:hypothetical protein
MKAGGITHARRTDCFFSQFLEWLPKYEFEKCVQRYQGNHRLRNFSCYDQFATLVFAQLTYRESLRDIETCLRALRTKLYHAGFRGKISRNTMAVANEKRDWRIHGDFAQILIGKALKLHTLLDLRGNFPSLVIITPGKVHDVNILDQLSFEAGAFYVMDRGYLDFERLYAIHQSLAFFVTRAKKNSQLRRRYSHPIDKSTGLRSDQTVVLKGLNSFKDYPQALRRIR